jgi:hypothetical protein
MDIASIRQGLTGTWPYYAVLISIIAIVAAVMLHRALRSVASLALAASSLTYLLDALWNVALKLRLSGELMTDPVLVFMYAMHMLGSLAFFSSLAVIASDLLRQRLRAAQEPSP